MKQFLIVFFFGFWLFGYVGSIAAAEPCNMEGTNLIGPIVAGMVGTVIWPAALAFRVGVWVVNPHKASKPIGCPVESH
jgi:hypothetical protein